MTESLENGKDANSRIQCLDFLRGFFVFLALWQHFGFYINYWYVNYYQGWSYWGELFEAHVPFVNIQISVDYLSHLAAWFFTPWVSQIYLFLAAFNLAKPSSHKNKNQKIAVFCGLFLLFTFENFIVAPNIGEALSLYPLQTWMICLILIFIVSDKFQEKGIWFLFFTGLCLSILPADNLINSFEQMGREYIHTNFEIDARPHYFLSSACLGYLFGRSWWISRLDNWKQWLVASTILILLWIIFGQEFNVNPSDVFASEHDQAKNIFGLFGIHGIELLIVGTFLFFYRKGFDVRIKFFNWIGRYSLLVFFLHRIIFTKIIMPIRMLVYNVWEFKIEAHFYEFWFYILIIVFCAWLTRKLRILAYLEGK